VKLPLLLALVLVGPEVSWADPTPRSDYILQCAGCHKLDGSGSEVVPALDQVGRVFAAGGREYLIRVPGVAQAPLSDERLAALMNWLVPRFGGNQIEPEYTAQEVRALRARPLRDPIAARNEILPAATEITNAPVPLPGGP
jgi:hypothetical protein